MRQSAAACFVDRMRGARRLRWPGRARSSPSSRNHAPIESAWPEQSVPTGKGVSAPWNHRENPQWTIRQLPGSAPSGSLVGSNEHTAGARRSAMTLLGCGHRWASEMGCRPVRHSPTELRPSDPGSMKVAMAREGPGPNTVRKEVNGQEWSEQLPWKNIGIRGTVFVRDFQMCCFVVFTFNFPLVAYSGA